MTRDDSRRAASTSPIAVLFDDIAASPFRVTDEATSALREVVAAKSLTLEFCESCKMKAQIVVERSVVQLGVPFLEVLWAAAYAYIVTFHECQQAGHRGESLFSIGDSPRAAQAYSLYRELLQCHAAGGRPQWSSASVRPVRFPVAGTDAFIANELFLVAVSWLVHHEIAHARLEHRPDSVSSKSEENDADAAATRWVCGEAKEEGPRHKRAMGIATAILLLIADDLETQRIYSSTHPPAFERLILSLDEAGLTEDEMPYAFAFKLIEVHLVQLGITTDFDRRGTHRDKCVAVCMLLRDAASHV